MQFRGDARNGPLRGADYRAAVRRVNGIRPLATRIAWRIRHHCPVRDGAAQQALHIQARVPLLASNPMAQEPFRRNFVPSDLIRLEARSAFVSGKQVLDDLLNHSTFAQSRESCSLQWYIRTTTYAIETQVPRLWRAFRFRRQVCLQ